MSAEAFSRTLPATITLEDLAAMLSGDGGRIPDVTVWSKPAPDAVWLTVTDLLLVIEIVSPGSEAIDQVVKVAEYAAVGIPQYWTVARDKAQTVTLYRLGA